MSTSAFRCFQVLEYLAAEGSSSLGKVATDLGLNKATAHRSLNVLVDAGYARQEAATRAYSPTIRMLELGSQVLEKIDLRNEVRPHLDALSEATGEAAHLALLDGLQIVYIDKIDGRQAVIMGARIGSRGPCHCTSLGKTLLASRPETEWSRYVEEIGLEARTPNTVTDATAFRTMLSQVRSQGYATDDIENEEGIRCVAAPLRDHTGGVVAAISISGWTVSMTAERLPEVIPVVVAHAAAASHALGYNPGT